MKGRSPSTCTPLAFASALAFRHWESAIHCTYASSSMLWRSRERASSRAPGSRSRSGGSQSRQLLWRSEWSAR